MAAAGDRHLTTLTCPTRAAIERQVLLKADIQCQTPIGGLKSKSVNLPAGAADIESMCRAVGYQKTRWSDA